MNSYVIFGLHCPTFEEFKCDLNNILNQRFPQFKYSHTKDGNYGLIYHEKTGKIDLQTVIKLGCFDLTKMEIILGSDHYFNVKQVPSIQIEGSYTCLDIMGFVRRSLVMELSNLYKCECTLDSDWSWFKYELPFPQDYISYFWVDTFQVFKFPYRQRKDTIDYLEFLFRNLPSDMHNLIGLNNPLLEILYPEENLV